MAWEPRHDQVESAAGIYYTLADFPRLPYPHQHLYNIINSWNKREYLKRDYGDIKPILWHTNTSHFMYYREDVNIRMPYEAKLDKGKIAYTANDIKGNRDIQTVTTVGKYLSMFHSDLPDTTKKALIDEWNAYYDDSYKLDFTDDPKEIARIYMNGPDSCMNRDADYFCRSHLFGNRHPVEVYGKPGDLSLAYLGPMDKAVARAVVDTEKKYFVRAYGMVERMEFKLKELGYSKCSDWDYGTKLNLHQHDDIVLCPYIDGRRSQLGIKVSDDGFLVIDSDGIGCNSTEGYLSLKVSRCHECGNVLDDDDYHIVDGDNNVCNDCYDRDYFYCHISDTSYRHEDETEVTYFDRHRYPYTACESVIENTSNYRRDDYQYDRYEALVFHDVRNTALLHLNNEEERRVHDRDFDEAYEWYVEQGLIDPPEDEDDEEDQGSLFKEDECKVEITTATLPEVVIDELEDRLANYVNNTTPPRGGNWEVTNQVATNLLDGHYVPYRGVDGQYRMMFVSRHSIMDVNYEAA